jgi:DNA-binding response OmpR family regulator
MLTARDAVEDIVQGLDLGADDYLTKPFSFNELLVRLEAVRRRAQIRFPSVLQVADLSMDLTTRTVTRANARIDLTRTEYTLLEWLMRNAGAIVPRQSLIEAVWGSERPIEDNTLDAFMRLLRNKIEAAGKHKLIHTARGAGYGLRPPLHQ